MAFQLHPWNSSTPWKPTKLSGISDPRVLLTLIVFFFIGFSILYFSGVINEWIIREGTWFSYYFPLRYTEARELHLFFIFLGISFIIFPLLVAIGIELAYRDKRKSPTK